MCVVVAACGVAVRETVVASALASSSPPIAAGHRFPLLEIIQDRPGSPTRAYSADQIEPQFMPQCLETLYVTLYRR